MPVVARSLGALGRFLCRAVLGAGLGAVGLLLGLAPAEELHVGGLEAKALGPQAYVFVVLAGESEQRRADVRAGGERLDEREQRSVFGDHRRRPRVGLTGAV